MQKILLAGDSWGIGEFSGSGDSYKPTGVGLESILSEKGYYVTNVSQVGISNREIVDRILDQNLNIFDIIIFLQTDPFRDHQQVEIPKDNQSWKRDLNQNFIDSLTEYTSLDMYFYDYFNGLYSELSNLDKPIICIGGHSILHPCILEYKNLISEIPSVTQLLLGKNVDDCYINDKDWIDQLTHNPKFMKKFGNEFKDLVILLGNKTEEILKNWNDLHPTALGYSKLANNLVELIRKI